MQPYIFKYQVVKGPHNTIAGQNNDTGPSDVLESDGAPISKKIIMERIVFSSREHGREGCMKDVLF